MAKQIFVTAQDRQRLLDALAVLQESPDKRELPHIRQLADELERAQVILDPLLTPRDVITMRSKVRLCEVGSTNAMQCTLVYPQERDPENGCISVLAPLGTAMLGYRVGDTFEVTLPKGVAEYLVEEVLYQPEAAGDYHL